MKEKELLRLANRIKALSQNGLLYSPSGYDTERYEELSEINEQMITLISGYSLKEIKDCFTLTTDYVTPKVDIRAVVFNENEEILLVKESADRLWSLPGGWADVGFSPSEVAVKEVKEETGLDVKPVRLLAVLDKHHHNHPPATHYCYKIFILCEITGGELATTFDILDKGFYEQDNLPPLSLERVLKEQIDLMYEYKRNPDKRAMVD